MAELPLVFFTVLSQSAAGLVIIGFIAYLLKELDQKKLNALNFIALAMFGIGFVIGMLHLGHPFRAINIIYGIGRSPMSNESVLSGAFGGLLLATIFLNYRGKAALAKMCNITTVVISIIFAWSTTNVYQFETVPTWGNSFTPFQMWMTVLMGGGAVALSLGAKKSGAIALLVGVVLSLLFKPEYYAFINHIAPELAPQQWLFWGIQLLCIAFGGFIAISSLLKKDSYALLLTGASLVMIGEFSARAAFYNLWMITM